uniref:Uncharacterized protein n=1 Tax=Muribaculaceae bacterium Z82 TaxID=2304548 RepID=A0A7C9NUF2_9BACT
MKILGLGIPELTILQVFLIPLAFFVVGLFAANLMIKSAQEKGHHRDSTGLLWVIAIFCTPIVLGLYVAGLPDRAATTAATPATGPSATPAAPRPASPRNEPPTPPNAPLA